MKAGREVSPEVLAPPPLREDLDQVWLAFGDLKNLSGEQGFSFSDVGWWLSTHRIEDTRSVAAFTRLLIEAQKRWNQVVAEMRSG